MHVGEDGSFVVHLAWPYVHHTDTVRFTGVQKVQHLDRPHDIRAARGEGQRSAVPVVKDVRMVQLEKEECRVVATMLGG